MPQLNRWGIYHLNSEHFKLLTRCESRSNGKIKRMEFNPNSISTSYLLIQSPELQRFRKVPCLNLVLSF